MDDEQLSLEIIGSPVPLDNSVRFAAHGLKDPKDWTYEWRVLGHGNVDVSEHRLTNADIDFKTTEVQPGSRFVDWIARGVPLGVYTVEVTATRRKGGQARAAEAGARSPQTKTESFVVHSRPLGQGDE